MSSKLRTEAGQDKFLESSNVDLKLDLLKDQLKNKRKKIKELENDKENLMMENIKLKNKILIFESTVEEMKILSCNNSLEETGNTAKRKNKVFQGEKKENQRLNYLQDEQVNRNNNLKRTEPKIELLKLNNTKLQSKCKELETENKRLRNKLNTQEEAQLLITIEKQKVH